MLEKIQEQIEQRIQKSGLTFDKGTTLAQKMKSLDRKTNEYIEKKRIEAIQYTAFGSSNLLSLKGYRYPSSEEE
jgi:hypothetical protein